MSSRLTCFSALVFLTIALRAIVLANEPPAKDELKQHQGTWAVTSSIYDGRPAPEAIFRSIQRVVDGNHVYWTRDGKRFAGTTIELDPAASPKAIDVIPDGGPNRGERVLGIYKLDGDGLTICVAEPRRPRPKDFQAGKGSRQTLRVFVRVRAVSPSGRAAS